MASKLTLQSAVRLNTGFDLPLLGFGVYQTPPPETATAVSFALKDGYRHIDTAIGYFNEEGCSSAMASSGLKREDIFLTSKIPPPAVESGYEATKKSIDESLQRTGLSWFDLFLLHSPSGKKVDRNGAWQALVEAQQAGKIRSIGVSNYGLHHLQELEAFIQEMEAKKGKGQAGLISVAQYELHPWCARTEIVDWCTQRGIVLEAYCPIVRGQRSDEPQLQALSKKYGKTPAQILIRWSLQKGFVPLPKSVTPSRITENKDVFDFELTNEEVETLQVNSHHPVAWDPTTWQD